MGDTISADLIVKAVVNGFDKIEGALKGSASASEDLSAAQNKLAQAIFNAESAAMRLVEAERELAENADPEMQRELEGALLDAKVEMDSATDKASELAQEYHAMGESANEAGDANEEAAFSFTELNSAIGVARQAIQMAGQAYDAVIAPVLELADAQRELALAGQISVEEAGKIIQIGDDLGISVGTLKTAFKEMAKDGIQPTLENLKEIANSYQEAETPTEALSIAQQSLGRSYQELLPFLEKTPAELDAMAASAEAAGIIMSGAAVKSAREYEIALDNLQDAMQGLGIATASIAFPALTALADRGSNGIFVIKELAQSMVEGRLNVGALGQGVLDFLTPFGNFQKSADMLNADLQYSAPVLAGWAGAWYSTQPAIAGTARVLSEAEIETRKNAEAQNLLAASMNGSLGPAFADTAAKQSSAAAEMAKVQKELDGLIAVQGKVITVTKQATTSHYEIEVAYDRQVTASNKLSDAQSKLNENTDPDKFFQLRSAFNSAALASEKADEAVGKFEEGMGSSSVAVVDNGKKIKELSEKKNELQAAIDAAADAERKLTNEFLFNQATASLDAEAQLELAKNLGLIDPTSYNAAKAMMELNQQYKDGKIELPEYIAKTKQIASDIETYGVAVGNISPKAQVASDAMRYVNQTIAATPDKTVVYDTSGIPGPTTAAVDAILRLNQAMHDAQDKTVQFTINYSETGAAGALGAGGYINAHQGDGHAAGGSEFAGVPRLVGEGGPEIFWPQSNGYTMSNGDMRSMVSALQQIASSGMSQGGGSISIGNLNMHDVGKKNPRQLATEFYAALGKNLNRYQRSSAQGMGR